MECRKFDALKAIDLRSVGEGLDPYLKDAIAIKSGQHNISASTQFESFYFNRRLIYPKTPEGSEAAKATLLIIIDNNRLLIEQLGKSNDVAKELSDFSIWKDTRVHIHGGKNTGTTSAGNVSTATTKSSGLSDSKGTTGSSDSNAYMKDFNWEEENNKVPLNVLSKNKGASKTASDSFSTSGSTSGTDSVYRNRSTDVTLASNAAVDLIGFLNMKNPDLRMKFGKKFEQMFLSS